MQRDYLAEIESAQAEVDSIRANITDLKRLWIEAECPVKIGSTVEVNGFSHTAKRMAIDRLWVDKGWHEWKWRATGFVFRKDGSIGKHRGEWSAPIIAK